jgi:hypothetical protein
MGLKIWGRIISNISDSPCNYDFDRILVGLQRVQKMQFSILPIWNSNQFNSEEAKARQHTRGGILNIEKRVD